MVKENDLVAIFHSIHRVLKAEKVLKKAQVNFLLIPVPRQLDSDCGLALRFSPDILDNVLAILDAENLSPVELHQRKNKAYQAIKRD